jgi:glycosyltransferase involved in cell wall biosynthesis
MVSVQKVIVVMPAYNAGRTLRMTYEALPREGVDLVIVVDDGSADETAAIARQLGLELFVHNRNYGYGANQKTCYTEALKAGGAVIGMVHPDYQYDPRLLPQLIEPLKEDRADVVLASRLLGESPIKQGMPWWKYAGNRFLTALENRCFHLRLSEYHTGYRAFQRKVLEAVNFSMNSDGFVFDQEILAQVIASGFRIMEVPVRAKYFPEASAASFWQSVWYGLSILWMLVRYVMHSSGLIRQKWLENLSGRYRRVPADEQRGLAGPE